MRTESGTVDGEKTPSDPDLAQVVEAWPQLPEAIRAAVLAIVRNAGSRDGEPQRHGEAPRAWRKEEGRQGGGHINQQRGAALGSATLVSQGPIPLRSL